MTEWDRFLIAVSNVCFNHVKWITPDLSLGTYCYQLPKTSSLPLVSVSSTPFPTLCTCFKCDRSPQPYKNIFLQNSHSYFGGLWQTMCCCKLHLRENAFPHFGHSKTAMRSCTTTWSISPCELANFKGHLVQANFFSTASWAFARWMFNEGCLMNFSPHK